MRRFSPCAVLGLAMATPLLLSACRDRRHDNGFANVSWVPRDTTRALGPGDIRITSIDSSVDLAIVGDSIVTGLSAKTIAKVRNDMAKDSGDQKSGLGASIAGFVKNTVASALDHQVIYPISDVRDVRYEDGRLIIRSIRGGTMSLFQSSRDNRGRDTFRPADAQAFIAAFNARKAGHAAQNPAAGQPAPRPQ